MNCTNTSFRRFSTLQLDLLWNDKQNWISFSPPAADCSSSCRSSPGDPRDIKGTVNVILSDILPMKNRSFKNIFQIWKLTKTNNFWLIIYFSSEFFYIILFFFYKTVNLAISLSVYENIFETINFTHLKNVYF